MRQQEATISRLEPRQLPTIPQGSPIILGEDEARRRVLKFLDEHFGEDYQPMKGEEIEDTFCVHMFTRGRENDPIEQFQFDHNESYEELATHIVSKAVEDAEGTNKSDNGYILKIVGARVGRTSFKIIFPSIQHDEDDDYEDDPTSRGIVSQQMGFTRELMKVAIGSAGETIRQLRLDMTSLREENRRLQREHLRAIQMVEELTQATHLRDLETRKAEKDDERKEQIVGTITALMPAAVNAFVGSRVVPQDTSPLEHMILQLGGTFTAEQLQEISTTGTIRMNPNQVLPFLQLFTAMKDKEEGKLVAPQQATPAKGTNPNFPMSK